MKLKKDLFKLSKIVIIALRLKFYNIYKKAD